MDGPREGAGPVTGSYPGHAARARRLILEYLPVVDCVVEVLDARIPVSSRHPEMPGLVRGKPLVIALNKADLADPDATRAWASAYREAGQPAWPVQSRRGTGFGPLRHSVGRLSRVTLEREAARGRRPRPPRIVVVGIPNVGKSSLLNRLLGRARARTGGVPGITRGPQWIRAGELEVLDMPGVLWPQPADGERAVRLALTGALAAGTYDSLEVARWLVRWLRGRAPGALPAESWTAGGELPPDCDAVLGAMARRWRFVGAGGLPDVGRAAERLILEFRAGRLGRLTLDDPPAGGHPTA